MQTTPPLQTRLSNSFRTPVPENGPIPASRLLGEIFGACLGTEVSESRTLRAEQYSSIDHCLGGHLAELKSLARERNPQLFFEALADIAQRLETEGQHEGAMLLYAAIRNQDQPRFSAAASLRLDAIEGRGDWRGRAGFLLRHFVEQVTDAPPLLAMLGAGATFRLARHGLVRILSNAGLNRVTAGVLAGAGAFSTEATAFPIYQRLASQALGRPADWGWNTLRHDIPSSFLVLGGLRAGGALGRWSSLRFHRTHPLTGAPRRFPGALPFTRHIFQQGGMLSGIMLGHGAEQLVGLRPGQFADIFAVESLVTLLHFNAAGILLHRLTPDRFQAWEQSIARRLASPRFARATGFAAGAGVLTLLTHPSLARALSAGELPQGQSEALALVALGLSAGLGVSIEMGMELGLEQTLKLSMRIENQDLLSSAAEIYNQAEIRRYRNHGLDFEYALVRRRDFPYMLAIGSPGLMMGPYRFVMEDFFLDLPVSDRSRLIELIAVHEYGESLFGNHHQASLLEFEVARREGFLQRHLEIFEERLFLKFRDINLHRMGPELFERMEINGVKVGRGVEEPENTALPTGDPQFEIAARLRDAFRWPAEIEDRFRILNEDAELARERTQDWADRITVNEQAKAYIHRASEAAFAVAQRRIVRGAVPARVLPQVLRAFYKPFRELDSELADGVLNKDYLQDEILAGATQDAHRNLRIGLERLIREQTGGTETQEAWNSQVADLPLWNRGLREHLEIPLLEREYLERAAQRGQWGEQQRARENLARTLQHMRETGVVADEGQALRVLSVTGTRRQDLPDTSRGLLESLQEFSDLGQFFRGIRKGAPLPGWVLPLRSFLETGEFPFAEEPRPELESFYAWLRENDLEPQMRDALIEAWETARPLPSLPKRTNVIAQFFRRRVIEDRMAELFRLAPEHPARTFFETGRMPQGRGRSILREFIEPIREFDAQIGEEIFEMIFNWVSLSRLSRCEILGPFREVVLRRFEGDLSRTNLPKSTFLPYLRYGEVPLKSPALTRTFLDQLEGFMLREGGIGRSEFQALLFQAYLRAPEVHRALQRSLHRHYQNQVPPMENNEMREAILLFVERGILPETALQRAEFFRNLVALGGESPRNPMRNAIRSFLALEGRWNMESLPEGSHRHRRMLKNTLRNVLLDRFLSFPRDDPPLFGLESAVNSVVVRGDFWRLEGHPDSMLFLYLRNYLASALGQSPENIQHRLIDPVLLEMERHRE